VREKDIVMTVTREVPAATRDRYRLPLLVFVLVGSAVAVGLGVYGREHEPTGYALNVVGFSGPLYVKAWLTTAAAVLAVVQLLTAGRMYDVAASAWVRASHRWAGRVSFVVKMLVLTRGPRPRWVVPVAGGALFTAVMGLWLTSSLWVFTTTGLHL
jgi:hypothetical protein